MSGYQYRALNATWLQTVYKKQMRYHKETLQPLLSSNIFSFFRIYDNDLYNVWMYKTSDSFRFENQFHLFNEKNWFKRTICSSDRTSVIHLDSHFFCVTQNEYVLWSSKSLL